VYSYPISPENIIMDIEVCDLVVLRFPNCGKNHKDITKYFSAYDSLSPTGGVEIRVPDMDGKIKCKLGDYRTQGVAQYTVQGVERTLDKTLLYKLGTLPGDCGVPVFLTGSHHGSRILCGLHVAGNEMFGTGFCTILEPLGTFVAQGYDPIYNKILGKVAAPRRVFATTIVKSKMFGSWGKAKSRPARLARFTSKETGEMVDPMDVAQEKYDVPPTTFLKEDIDEAYACLFNEIVNETPFNVDNLRLLSWKEAIFGVEGNPFIKSLDMSTSMGFPFNTMSSLGEKKQYFHFDEMNNPVITERGYRLLEECDEIMDNIAKGVKHDFIFTDLLKDEKRPIDKVLAGKTRCFFAGNIHLLLIMRKLTGSFMGELTRVAPFTEVAIAVNPYGYDWSRIYRHLTHFGRKCGFGDIKGYDTNTQIEMPQAFCEQLIKLHSYSSEYQCVMRYFPQVICESLHVVDGLLVKHVSGLPSGVLWTMILNSLNNCVIHRIAFKYLTKMPMFHFKKYIRFLAGGDDNAHNVHVSIQHQYNMNTLAQFLETKGLIYTDEFKNLDGFQNSRDIGECSFFKRSFKYCNYRKRIVGPLNLETVLEIPYWTKKGKDADLIAVDNALLAIGELSFHTKEVFDKFSPGILSKLREFYDYCSSSTTYEEWIFITEKWGNVDVMTSAKGWMDRRSISFLRDSQTVGRYRFSLVPQGGEFVYAPPTSFCKRVDDEWNDDFSVA
jgi:hypothetical protein